MARPIDTNANMLGNVAAFTATGLLVWLTWTPYPKHVVLPESTANSARLSHPTKEGAAYSLKTGTKTEPIGLVDV